MAAFLFNNEIATSRGIQTSMGIISKSTEQLHSNRNCRNILHTRSITRIVPAKSREFFEYDRRVIAVSEVRRVLIVLDELRISVCAFFFLLLVHLLALTNC